MDGGEKCGILPCGQYKQYNGKNIMKISKCDQETGFIARKPVLLPEYNLYKIPAVKSHFQTQFDKFKTKVYSDKTEEDLKTFFKEPKNLKALRTNPDYLQNLSAARKRTYIDFKYIPIANDQTPEQFIIGSKTFNKDQIKALNNQIKALKDEDKPIIKAIINSIFGNIPIHPADAAPVADVARVSDAVSAQKTTDATEKKKLQFALNILNYENEVLRGNINTRLNKYNYKISNTDKKTERNFEGYIDNNDNDNVYADKAFLTLNGTLLTKLKEFTTITDLPIKNLPLGQEQISQAKPETTDSKIKDYIKNLKSGSHIKDLLKQINSK